MINNGRTFMIIDSCFGAIALSADQVADGLAAARELSSTVACDWRTCTEDPQASSAPVFVDAEKIAQIFQMDASWFLARAREDRIPHVRIGKYVRFNPQEIRDYFHREAGRHAE